MGEEVVDGVGGKVLGLSGDVRIEVSCCGSLVVTWVAGIVEFLGVVWVVVVVVMKSCR